MHRKITISCYLIILMLTLTQLATAQWKHNEFTNDTSNSVYVAFATYQPNEGQIPEGWRTMGWYHIKAGESQTFQGWADNAVYYLIFQGGNFILPANAKLFTSSMSRKPFILVTQTETGAADLSTEILYTSVDKNMLTENTKFFKSGNGGAVTVTSTGVVAPLAELEELTSLPDEELTSLPEEPVDDGETESTILTTTRTFTVEGKQIGILEPNYWYDWNSSVTFPGTVTEASADETVISGRATVGHVTKSGNTVTVHGRILAKTFPISKINVTVTGKYDTASEASVDDPKTEPTILTATRTFTVEGKQIGILEPNYWYDWNSSVTFPGTVTEASADETVISGRATVGHVTKSGNTVTVHGRILAKTFPISKISVTVTGKYESNNGAAAPILQPQLRPEIDPLPSVWQDLSQVPSETALLPNYPNPFNPETWIPYHLSDSADVTLSIYSADGKLVRTLVLGHQQAGVYESKSRAAYWDGRNTVGERVASGLYFYTLTAGDFTSTGKMLIMK